MFKKLVSRLFPKQKYEPSHMTGPLIDKNIDKHIPLFEAEVIDEHSNNLNDQQISARKQSNMSMYLRNPIQDLDLQVIAGLCQSTIVGSLMNGLTRFIVGRGCFPVLELKNPDKENPDKNEQAVKKHQYVIDKLLQIDEDVCTGTDGLDINFKDKISQLIDLTNTFHRAALVFGYDSDSKIPSSMWLAHPRDLGIIELSDKGRLQSVQYRFNNEMISHNDMIYLWAPLLASKHHNSQFYGSSMILPMLDACRTLRQIISIDFPAMARSTWSGLFLLTIAPQGQTADQKRTEFDEIQSSLKVGASNILVEDPANVKVDTIDFNPKVNEFRELCDYLVKMMIATLQLPTSGFFDESVSNRSTLLSKIQLCIETTIKPIRQSFSDQINVQWYQKNFLILFPELSDKFKITLKWNDLSIEETADKIEAVLAVDARKRLKDSAFGKLAHIDDYENSVIPGAATTPGGAGIKKTGHGENGL